MIQWLKYAARLLQLADWPGILDVIFASNEASEATSLNALGWTEHPSTVADRRHRLIWSIMQSIGQSIDQKLNQNQANVATYRHVSLSVFAVLSYASTVYAMALCLSVRLSQVGVLSKQLSYMLCGVRASCPGNCGHSSHNKHFRWTNQSHWYSSIGRGSLCETKLIQFLHQPNPWKLLSDPTHHQHLAIKKVFKGQLNVNIKW